MFNIRKSLFSLVLIALLLTGLMAACGDTPGTVSVGEVAALTANTNDDSSSDENLSEDKDFSSVNDLVMLSLVAPSTSGLTSCPSMKEGASGGCVKLLQTYLNMAGASPQLTVDQVYGKLTKQAVVDFQKSKGLKADGIAGPQTKTALINALSVATPGNTVNTNKFSQVAEIAKQIEKNGFNGVPVQYSWGGGHKKIGPTLGTCNNYTGTIRPCPAEHVVGVDCSGFVRWVYYLAYGRDILGDGNTDSQLAKLKKLSSKNEAQPGDLVFYWTYDHKTTHHVGIYVGNGQIVDAPATGDFVQKESVDSHKYYATFAHYNG